EYRRQPRGRANVNIETVADLVDGLIEPQEHVFAKRLAAELDNTDGLIALSVFRLGTKVKGVVHSHELLLAPEHFHVARPLAGLAELLVLGRDAKFAQAGVIGFQLGKRLSL